MEIKLHNLLEADIFRQSCAVAGIDGLDNLVSSINVIDGISGTRYVRPKMLLITSGYFLAQSAPDKICRMLRDFSECGVAGLISKVKHFENHTFPEYLLNQANECRLPLIELANDDATFTDFFSFFYSHLYCVGIKQFRKFGELTQSLINSIKNHSLPGFVSELHKLSGRNVIVHFNRDNLTYPADIQETSSLSHKFSKDPAIGIIENSKRFPELKEYILSEPPFAKKTIGLGIDFDVKYKPMGSIWLDCFDRPYDDNDAILLEKAKLAAELEIRQLISYQQEELELRARLVDKLLGGSLRTWHETTLFISGLRWHVPAEFKIFVVLSEHLVERYQDICLEVCQYFQNYDEQIFVHQFERNTVIFLPCNKQSTDMIITDFIAYLIEKFPEAPIRFGLGRKTLLHNANVSYEEAIFAARIGWKIEGKGKFGDFSKLGYYRLFSPAQFPDEMKRFCRDYLLPLLEFQSQPSSSLDLLGTLKVYFETGKHLSKTAQKLHLQPNSVRYRLRVIEESCQIDFSNNLDSISMQVAVALLDVLGVDSIRENS